MRSLLAPITALTLLLAMAAPVHAQVSNFISQDAEEAAYREAHALLRSSIEANNQAAARDLAQYISTAEPSIAIDLLLVIGRENHDVGRMATRHAIGSSNEAIAREGMVAMRRLGVRSNQDLEPIRLRLDMGDSHTRIRALETLREADDDRRLPAVISLMNSPDPEVAAEARRTAEALTGQHFGDNPSAWNAYIDNAMTEFDQTSLRLQPALSSGSANECTAAIRELMAVPGHRALVAELIAPLAGDENPEIARLARLALMQCGEEVAVRALEDAGLPTDLALRPVRMAAMAGTAPATVTTTATLPVETATTADTDWLTYAIPVAIVIGLGLIIFGAAAMAGNRRRYDTKGRLIGDHTRRIVRQMQQRAMVGDHPATRRLAAFVHDRSKGEGAGNPSAPLAALEPVKPN